MATHKLHCYYATRLDTAQGLLDKGEQQSVQEAIDICFELSQNSDLGIYTRARLNMILAKSYQTRRPQDTPYIELYAYEVLNQFHIYRQLYDKETSAGHRFLMEYMEETAKDIIDDVARSKLSRVADRRNRDGTEETKTNSKDSEQEQITLPVQKATKIGPPPSLVWQTTPRTLEMYQIEDYLRDAGKFKDIIRYNPLSRETQLSPINTAEALGVSDQPTPASAGDYYETMMMAMSGPPSDTLDREDT